MDALRLIKTARHALAEARTVPDVLAEAWQAGLLTEAVGARIAEREDGEIGALGQLLCDAGAHAVSCLDQPPTGPAADDGTDPEWSRTDWVGSGRAGRLDEVGELEPALEELGRLLHEVAETLVVLACGADAESLYWRCIDGVDAGAECKDLVAELLRTVRKETYQDEGQGEGEGPDRMGPGPSMMVVPLGPPVSGSGYRPRADESVGLSVAPGSVPRAPEECRSASSPAREALREASSSCICSSRLLGVAAEAVCCGVTGASDQGSDMRGPLQLGSAV
ncbi:DUF6099 family protein [Kitasatospora atroaurantiaca]|uniref:Uncharacterized protein n=1 Tax=Kitasatospora atroaurantiaca TaxID=285545 RepID=A0A561EP17_9ACTN|nr:hypothetical protein FB465_2379 [Kitasatospora atroaurantiaca]